MAKINFCEITYVNGRGVDFGGLNHIFISVVVLHPYRFFGCVILYNFSTKSEVPPTGKRLHPTGKRFHIGP